VTARYEAIAMRIASDIESGLLAPGERLPSLRSLCATAQVSLMTALAAYRKLEALQLVEAVPRSGYRVRLARARRLERPAVARTRMARPSSSRAAILREVLAAVSDPALAPLGLACPASELFPLATLRRITGSLLAARPELWTTYSLPPGSPELRRLLAQRLSARGLRVRPSQVLITNGAMEGLYLCLRAVVRPGDVVAVECPTFFGILDAIQSVGARVLELPGDPERGLDAACLLAALREHVVRAVVLMPTFANPSGSSMPDENKRAIAKLLREHRVALIEDDLYAELAFDQRTPLPLWAHTLEGKAPSFLVSSFSKTLLPAGRVGHVVAPEAWLERVIELKRVTSLANAGLPERLAAECLSTGVYDRHLRRMNAKLHQNVRKLEHLVAEAFPEGTKTSHPRGGYMLWVELPPGCHGERLFWAARKARIGIVPGNVFSLASDLRRFIRLSAGSSLDFEASVRTLGRLAREQLAG
jgi:DNA-binding transcriptional MocR family regulator